MNTPLAVLALLTSPSASASDCARLTSSAEKINCLISAVEGLTEENAELIDRLEAIEGDYATSSAVVNLRGRVSTAEDAIDAIEADYLTSGDVSVDEISDLLGYLYVDTSSDEVVFTGANVYIQSGEGSTDDNCAFYDETMGTYAGACAEELTGLGNLIIGYNEDYSGDRARTGSHNLVIGADHSYTSYGSVVAGFQHTATAQYAAVFGGRGNTASADFGVVVGGSANTARGSYATVSGGGDNVAQGSLSAVSGGTYNTATNDYAAVSGGYENTASGYAAVVSGGYQNVASGTVAVVGGGSQNTASGEMSYAP